MLGEGRRAWCTGITWGPDFCRGSQDRPLRIWGAEERERAYPNVSDPRCKVFRGTCFCRQVRAPARNGDPRDIAFCWTCYSQKTKAPARNADPRDMAFSWTCFSQKTRAPARNADPRDIAFVWACFFPRKTTAPARNADPNTTAFTSPTRTPQLFEVHVFLRTREPLLGTPIRVG